MTRGQKPRAFLVNRVHVEMVALVSTVATVTPAATWVVKDRVSLAQDNLLHRHPLPNRCPRRPGLLQAQRRIQAQPLPRPGKLAEETPTARSALPSSRLCRMPTLLLTQSIESRLRLDTLYIRHSLIYTLRQDINNSVSLHASISKM